MEKTPLNSINNCNNSTHSLLKYLKKLAANIRTVASLWQWRQDGSMAATFIFFSSFFSLLRGIPKRRKMKFFGGRGRFVVAGVNQSIGIEGNHRTLVVSGLGCGYPFWTRLSPFFFYY
jgi:hypothetical protein